MGSCHINMEYPFSLAVAIFPDRAPVPSPARGLLSLSQLTDFLALNSCVASTTWATQSDPYLYLVIHSSPLLRVFSFSFSCFSRKADWRMQHLIWMCQESWKPGYPIFSYKWTLRELRDHWLKKGPLWSSKPDRACSLGKNAHGAVRDKGNYPPRQLSLIHI